MSWHYHTHHYYQGGIDVGIVQECPATCTAYCHSNSAPQIRLVDRCARLLIYLLTCKYAELEVQVANDNIEHKILRLTWRDKI